MLNLIGKACEDSTTKKDQNIEEAYEMLDQFELIAHNMKQKMKHQIKKNWKYLEGIKCS